MYYNIREIYSQQFIQDVSSITYNLVEIFNIISSLTIISIESFDCTYSISGSVAEGKSAELSKTKDCRANEFVSTKGSSTSVGAII